ncbi:MAG: hypothetical protein RIT24_1722 [Planctomycetota bacterium]|jgi:hypothetical protein
MGTQPTTFTLDAMQFFGRLGGDYEAMFGIDLASLRGLAVLDCPSGPSSFIAELEALGIDAVGVDPLYAETRDHLLARGRDDIAHTIAQMRANPVAFADLDLDAYALGKHRALERFAAHFDAGKASGRYIAASLPALPFADRSFDLTLSAHLLFTYSDPATGGLLKNSPFTPEWHLAAARELMRVTRGELRLYPTTTRWAKPCRHPLAEAVAAMFAADGLQVRYEPSAFARGNHAHDELNACLVVTRERSLRIAR